MWNVDEGCGHGLRPSRTTKKTKKQKIKCEDVHANDAPTAKASRSARERERGERSRQTHSQTALDGNGRGGGATPGRIDPKIRRRRQRNRNAAGHRLKNRHKFG